MGKYTKSNIRRRKTLKKRGGGGIPNKSSFPNFINRLIYSTLGVNDSDQFSSLYDSSIEKVNKIKQKYDVLKQMYTNDIKIDKFNDEEYQVIFNEIDELVSELYRVYNERLFHKFYGEISSEDLDKDANEDYLTEKKIMNYFGLYDDTPIINALYEKEIMFGDGYLFLPKETI
jgi:hypothetical protein